MSAREVWRPEPYLSHDRVNSCCHRTPSRFHRIGSPTQLRGAAVLRRPLRPSTRPTPTARVLR